MGSKTITVTRSPFRFGFSHEHVTYCWPISHEGKSIGWLLGKVSRLLKNEEKEKTKFLFRLRGGLWKEKLKHLAIRIKERPKAQTTKIECLF